MATPVTRLEGRVVALGQEEGKGRPPMADIPGAPKTLPVRRRRVARKPGVVARVRVAETDVPRAALPFGVRREPRPGLLLIGRVREILDEPVRGLDVGQTPLEEGPHAA